MEADPRSRLRIHLYIGFEVIFEINLLSATSWEIRNNAVQRRFESLTIEI